MSVIQGSGKRCVIWFGEPEPHEKSALAAGGWQMREISAQQSLNIGMRDDDLVVGLVDLRNTALDSLGHIAQLAAEHRHLPLLAIVPPQAATASSHVKRLLGACRKHFPAPLDLDALLHHLQDIDDPLSPERNASSLGSLLGHSDVMLRMQAMLHKFAVVDLPVLITGETGTGKEAAAHALHQLSSRRNNGFHAINCGAIPSTLVQSELFGHEKGAFTGANSRRQGLFEAANGGTVFLDEVGDLPMDAQTSLLRVLQEGSIERVGSNTPIPVDVRILAATHVDLEQAVENGSFRCDLFYRLNVLRLIMPPLRQREGDIVLLAEHFLHEFRRHHHTRARDYSPAAIDAMTRFHWPGNVRELLNRVHLAAVTAETELIGCEDLGLKVAALPSPLSHAHNHAQAHATEREQILACLAQTRYNVSACAQLMDVSRVTIYRLSHKHQIDLEALRHQHLDA